MPVIPQKDFSKVYSMYRRMRSDFLPRNRKIIDITEKITGNMWSAADRRLMEEQYRPITEYVLIESMRNAYVGTERSSRVSMRYVPVVGGNIKTASLLTSAKDWNYARTWYDWNKSKHFLGTTIGGVAFSQDFWNFNKGHWIFEPFDPLRVRWDTRTRKITFEDCRYIQDTQFLTAEEIYGQCQDYDTRKEVRYKLKWNEPKEGSNIFFRKFDEGSGWMDTVYDEEDVDIIMGRYRTIEHHEKRDVRNIYLIDDENHIVDCSDWNDEQVSQFIDDHQGKGYEIFEFPPTQEYWITTIVPTINMIIRNEKYPLKDPKGFAFKPMVAYDIKPYLKDAQGIYNNPLKVNDSFNKRKAVEMQYAIETVGGEYIMEEGADEGHEEEWTTDLKRKVRHYKVGFDKPTRQQPGTVPASLFQYTSDEIGLFDRISNITPSFRGFKESANETGPVVSAKIRQTSLLMQPIMDNVTLSQMIDAESCREHIRQYMTDEQLRKLIESGDIKADGDVEELLKSVREDAQYATEIDSSRPSATQRQLLLADTAQYMQMFPQLAQFTRMDLVWSNTNLPDSDKQAEFAKAMYKKLGIDVDNLENINPEAVKNLLSMNQNMPQPGTPSKVAA